MTFQIALNFEDGVTRFIECKPNEVVADASYRQRINIPLDCRDGACGTCKSFCESGSYDGGDYIEDALTDEEADEGYVLTCQMVPESDLILRIPATSDVAKTSIATHSGEVTHVDRVSDTAIAFGVKLANPSSTSVLTRSGSLVTPKIRWIGYSEPPAASIFSSMDRNGASPVPPARNTVGRLSSRR